MSEKFAQTLKQSDSGLRQWPIAAHATGGGKQAIRSFLQDLRAEHGPLGLLGRFFLNADKAVRNHGVTLAFASLGELGAVNESIQDPWWDLMPMFDSRVHRFEPDRALCLLGYDADGEVVATQAARVYDVGETNLKSVAEDLSLFYGSAKPPVDAFCRSTAPSAEHISGLVTYSGCGWYRQDYRGRLLSAILPRISRSLALAMWNTEYTISIIDWILVEKGVSDRYGYHNADDGVLIHGFIEPEFRGALTWMHQDELLKDLRAFLGDASSEVDVTIGRSGDQERLAQRVGER
ncbi:MAG: hypothetical protein GKR94_08430 [Gammaproteobacteria bacterium]|nr:hypothetical protein [Gammaproteobacteria bacterium]